MEFKDNFNDVEEDEEATIENFYSDDDANFTDDLLEEEADVVFKEDDAVLEEISVDDSVGQSENFTILRESEIRRVMEDGIEELSTVLNIQKVEAIVLLLNYNWSVGKVHDAWFADECEVRKKVGLLEEPLVIRYSDENIITCGICLESYQCDRIHSTICGHPFCRDCWVSYISTAINDGPGCLYLRCPTPSCGAAVYQDMMIMLASEEEEKKRYFRYLVGSYVDENKKRIKWCPAPDCEYAVDFVAGSGSFDVSCLCNYRFCWNCCEEIHRPVDCETVKKWISKNDSESANVKWILAYTKPCPKCKKPIEKNQGCNHMTCRPPCGFQFCWYCLQPITNHAYQTCNSFRKAIDTDIDRKNAREYIEKYTHYFERFENNKRSMIKGINDLKLVQTVGIEELSQIQCQPEIHLKFLTKAWQQIIECRRVLRWSYAYGYYLPQTEQTKIQLFEYLQNQAESSLERLHHCAESELKPFLNAASPSSNFNEFRKRLVVLTSVTKNYFENLVTALENGLSDVSCSSQSLQAKRKRGVGSSRGRVGQWTCFYCANVNDTSAMACKICQRGYWSCLHCTYKNPRSAKTCQICSEPL